MTKDEWFEMNERTRPVMQELTDEFVDLCEKEPNNVMMRLSRMCGLPEGVDPSDERILKLFNVKDEKGD